MDLNRYQSELEDVKQTRHATKRVISEGLEEILYEPLPVLDHGFVRVVDYMGDDAAIVQAARVSYGKGTKKVNQDQGLINYLMRHRHTTPFEMCEIKLHVKLPIFVARQWIRHRTANVNEYSARYSILDKEFYLPNHENLAAQSQSNRQGRDAVLQGPYADQVLDMLKRDSEQVYSTYEYLLNEDSEGNVLDEERQGLARELARMNLSVNYYTQWYWKVDLHNFMRFLSLRADAHAQYEIRAYADVMLKVLEKWAPMTYKAFEEYQMHGAYFSKTALQIIQDRLQGAMKEPKEYGMSAREWAEVAAKLGL